VVKSTSENALKNSQKKKPDRSKTRSGGTGTKTRTRVRVSPSGNKSAGSLHAIFLVGFMGAGKSSVGRALGQRLNWIFEDLDDRIERREGRKIADIFRDSGELAFRRAEHEALQELVQELQRGISRIVALGGGAFVQSGNAKLLKNAGVTTLFLDAPVEELWQRCCRQANELGTDRPLLRSKDQFRELHLVRSKKYSAASLRFETGGRAVDAIADEIVQKLKLKKIEVRSEEGEVE
jgi:shikimate kinase